MQLTTALLLLSFLTFTCPVFAVESSMCREFLLLETDISKKLPMKVDEITTLVEFAVNCETKIVKYVKHLSVGGSALASGFADRKQRQYLNLHCNKEGLATLGWTSIDNIYDKDMNLIMRLIAAPENCLQRNN